MSYDNSRAKSWKYSNFRPYLSIVAQIDGKVNRIMVISQSFARKIPHLLPMMGFGAEVLVSCVFFGEITVFLDGKLAKLFDTAKPFAIYAITKQLRTFIYFSDIEPVPGLSTLVYIIT